MQIRLKSLLLRPFFCISRSCAAPLRPDLTPAFPYGRYKGPGPLKMENGFGCDYNHWLIKVKKPVVDSRDEIIDGYIQLVAQVLGSEDEARKQIYSVSTKYYFAVGVLASRDVADKFKQLPDVVDVTRDTYVDIATKDYGGEPFVDGKPVPYDPKHHALYHRVWDTSDQELDAMLKATFKARTWDPLGDGETSKSEKEKEGTEMGGMAEEEEEERQQLALKWGSWRKAKKKRARIINIRNAKKKRALKLAEAEEEEYWAEEEEYRRWVVEEEHWKEAEKLRRWALKLLEEGKLEEGKLAEEEAEEHRRWALKLAGEEEEEEEIQQLALKWGKSKNVSSSPGRVTMG